LKGLNERRVDINPISGIIAGRIVLVGAFVLTGLYCGFAIGFPDVFPFAGGCKSLHPLFD
jgi:hypothetical protein